MLFGFKIDLWTVWGFFAQFLFFMSFVVQWYKSEKKQTSYLPLEFWVIRITATVLLTVYVLIRKDLVLLISYILQMFMYARNIYLYKKKNR
jgi:lipid-A-disaccharide synthase-like uncharacterized protein